MPKDMLEEIPVHVAVLVIAFSTRLLFAFARHHTKHVMCQCNYPKKAPPCDLAVTFARRARSAKRKLHDVRMTLSTVQAKDESSMYHRHPAFSSAAALHENAKQLDCISHYKGFP
jgi:hypothetical protein